MKLLGNILAALMVIGIVATIIDQPLVLLGFAVIAAIAWPFRTRGKHFPPSDF